MRTTGILSVLLTLWAFLGLSSALADAPPPALLLKTPEAVVLMQGGRNEEGACVVKLTITDRTTKHVLMDGLVACEMLEKLLRMTRGEVEA